jgi:hypothetical protein
MCLWETVRVRLCGCVCAKERRRCVCACGRMGDFLCVCACVWVCVYAVHIFYFCLFTRLFVFIIFILRKASVRANKYALKAVRCSF